MAEADIDVGRDERGSSGIEDLSTGKGLEN
jgi:hypothetical protein